MEPVVGFEPTTDGLQNRCSATELNWLSIGRKNDKSRSLTMFSTGFNRQIYPTTRELDLGIAELWKPTASSL